MKNKSIWYNVNKKVVVDKKIKIDTQDILIIGGGITGINIAYQLRDSNLKITLIDKSGIGSGITKNTTAKISYLQPEICKINKNKQDKYLKSQIEGINILKNIILNNDIDCDFKKSDSILFTQNKNNISEIETILKILKNNKVSVSRVKNSKIKYGIKVSETYTFNPLKYLNGIKNIISKNINIYENILAKKIKYKNNLYYVYTNYGIIKSKKVVLACHYPFFILPFFFPIKTHIIREYVNAFKTNTKDYNAINIDNDLHSVRFYDEYLIYGSNKHKLTNKTDYKYNYDKSINDTFKYFGKQSEYIWMNQDIVSNDYIPFIGKIKKNLYIATAYNGWGMTNSSISSIIIYDLINNNSNTYIDLFNPNRLNIKLFINSFGGLFCYLKIYIKSLFKKNNPRYVKIKNIYYGIYKDENNKYHNVKLLCPHMKCNLVFNEVDKTWDCPCHGSRFDIDGNIISTPAIKNIKKNE